MTKDRLAALVAVSTTHTSIHTIFLSAVIIIVMFDSYIGLMSEKAR